VFPETWKRKALAEELESEEAESDEEQGHGKVPCDTCCERKPACEEQDGLNQSLRSVLWFQEVVPD
jgi:hypothetical protein